MSIARKLYDQQCEALARAFVEDNKDSFQANKIEGLIDMLAGDIQSTIEGFLDFPDLTLKHLRQRELREAGEI